MPKILSFVCLILLCISSVAFSEANLAAKQIETTITVDPHAKAESSSVAIDLGQAIGKTGIYYQGETFFADELTDIWSGNFDLIPLNTGLNQSVTVATNCSTLLTFSFERGNNWLNSKTIFGVWPENDQYMIRKYFGDVVPSSSRIHQNPGSQEYNIAGSFLIEYVNQQPAGNYQAEICITVEAE